MGVSDFSFVQLRPFFYAALAKRWKVKFRQGFAYFNNNVDSKRHIIIRTAILYIYIYSVCGIICHTQIVILVIFCDYLHGISIV